MTLPSLLKRALADLWNDLGTHMLTTVVIFLSALIFSFFSLIYFNLQNFVEHFGTELGLVIYLNKATPQDRIPALYQKLAGLEGVQAVVYISPDAAFKRLASYLKDEKDVLKGVDPKFLPPSFELRINRAVFHLDRLKRLAEKINRWPEVTKVQYGQEWLNKLKRFSVLLRAVVLISGLLLVLSSAFVVSNTIKLTVYAREQEMEILRLVGATNGFIQGPFLIEAFFQGLLGSGLALAFLYAGYRYVETLMGASCLLKGVNISFLPWTFIGIILFGSIFLCVSGTALAMRRFLRL